MRTEARLKLIGPICAKFRGLETDDAIQECWIKTHLMTSPGLIVTTTRNLCKDLLRRKKVRSIVRADSDLVDRSDIAEIFQEPNEKLRILDLANLTSWQRDLLYRRFYCGQSLREMSRQLNVSVNQLHKDMTRTLTILKEIRNEED